VGDNNIPGFDALCGASFVKPILARTRLNNPSVLSVRVKVSANALPRIDMPRNNGRILGFGDD
jgi:hypothetical protein